MKLPNTLEAIALQIYHSTDVILTDVRRGNLMASRQKWLDIQQAAWAALNELDGPKLFGMTELNIVYKDVPLRVLLDQDGGMYVYIEDKEITDLLLSSTLVGIEAVVKEALIEMNTEDGQ